MLNMLKQVLRPLVPTFILERRAKQWIKTQLAEWHFSGCLLPVPHIVKQITIAYYQKKYAISLLIETGTYFGDMVEAQKKCFKEIISIELDVTLFKNAEKRFARDKNVRIVQGDSGAVLPEIVNRISAPAIFWLDGHYSGGVTAIGEKACPIFEELDAILIDADFAHILLIDDARCFNGEGDYPAIDKLTEYIKSKNEKYQVEIKNDIIHYVINSGT